MGLLGYGYQDPLAGMENMQAPQMRFSPMQVPGLLTPPQQKQGSGLLGNYVNPSTLTSFFGGGTGGANFGDMARNWLGSMANPGDPYGLNSKNAAAGLNQPDLSGAEMTGLLGGASQMQMPQMQAPPLPQQPQKNSSGFGSLLKLALLA